MALLYSKIKCPNCLGGSLTRIDLMVRCTCGWWALIDESEELLTTYPEYASIISS